MQDGTIKTYKESPVGATVATCKPAGAAAPAATAPAATAS